MSVLRGTEAHVYEGFLSIPPGSQSDKIIPILIGFGGQPPAFGTDSNSVGFEQQVEQV